MTLCGLVLDYAGVLTDPGELPGAGAAERSEPPLYALVRRLRRAGVRVALLSNSEAGAFRPEWTGIFDDVVLSGEVGVEKPDPTVFRLAAHRLGLEPGECVFVDDLRENVDGAVTAGMVGVRHLHVESTEDEIGVLFPRGSAR